ncbi:hypothetical protein EKO23_04715 [Nocardioides guangzhouensis]|uniref:TOMM leader peptide-binding protein n=1 Tax=Nocardioides guangzhouensis TaxID=2497878 RepID=A0A4Q4ZHN2_9ACTN|nr:hypothetical protein [Nocardioides guangzhouensis]RYP87703.1 hypothetical protein EKO23_04715 [Nocardioides guangzhouensis]
MSRPHPAYPARPLLRPGARVCRRADGQLQVGLEARIALVAPDTAEVRTVLDGLLAGSPPPHPSALSPRVARLCSDLLDRGLVVDGDDLLSAVGAARDRRTAETVAATFAEHGTSAGDLLRARARAPVRVLHQRAPRSAARCRALLAEAGVAEGDGGPVLLVARTEPDRALTDTWMRADRPHLLVTLVDGVVRVGPFVVPGQTSCVRCVDAHHTEVDPRRSLVLQQYAEVGRPRVGFPDPVPHDLLELALAWAVRDLVGWIDGRRPRSWSATLQVDPGLMLPLTPWPAHPACGCSWGVRFAG